ncbi:MAG: nuclear transport factor 2 family protein [Rhizobiales bacterium]|nr:nuclear transport factor 2 family protein [Hyphomicrobiales bacterium]MBN9009503.1 nuclear transport factor 2 family protein [Hyphomicrobiales bacterium]
MAADRTATIEALYRALNQRNLDAALVHLGPGATWPNAETGGTVSGREALRAYFTALWAKVDPIMEPVRIEPGPAGETRVIVDQLVRSRDGKVIDHGQFEHLFTFDGPFVSRMVSTPLAVEPDEDEDEDQ